MKPSEPATLTAWLSRLAASTLVALAAPAASSAAEEAPDNVTDRVEALRQRWHKDADAAAQQGDEADAPRAQANLWDDWSDWDDWKNWADSA